MDMPKSQISTSSHHDTHICWTLMVGHAGPGFFINILGLLGFLQCVNKKYTPKARVATIFYLTAILSPLGFIAEYSFSNHIGMENIHHFIVHALVGMDAIIIYCCDFRQWMPMRWRITYEAMAFLVAGFIFIAHANGNALYNTLHFIMFPALAIMGILHFMAEESSNKSLWLLRSLWISMTGGWLQNIGYGFFSLPGCVGYYGEASSTMDSKMIMSPVSAQIAYQFLMWIAIYSIGFGIANWLGYDVSFVDKEFDDETKHFEYEMANDLLTTHDDFEETKENVYMKHISPRSIMVGIADKDLSYGKIPVVADV